MGDDHEGIMCDWSAWDVARVFEIDVDDARLMYFQQWSDFEEGETLIIYYRRDGQLVSWVDGHNVYLGDYAGETEVTQDEALELIEEFEGAFHVSV